MPAAVLTPVDGHRPVYKTVVGANPAAGAEVSQTVAPGLVWELLGISVQLVQGLTQTPQPVLIVDDGVNPIFESLGASAAQAVSTTAQYNWAPGLALAALVGATPNIFGAAPLPVRPLVLQAGYRIRTSTLGIGANTDYGAPTFFVAEYTL